MQLRATILGSALSGMIARIPCHPMDTVKARLQAQGTPMSSGAAALPVTPQYHSARHALMSIWGQEGLKGLYRGFGVTFVGSAPATMLYFTTYEICKRNMVPGSSTLSNAPLVHFCSGMVAEAVSCILWVPIDVIKERMQVQRLTTNTDALYYRSAPDAMRKIMAYEGLRGIYRGYGATLASFGPFSAFYFVFYEELKRMALTASGVTDGILPFTWQVGTACSAGAAASLITNPLDMAKLRIQVQRGIAAQGDGSGFRYRNLLHALQTIVRDEGLLALFKGAGARMAFHAPATAITMTLFERAKQLAAHFLEA
jgi:hypothetical protein